jgi:YidC/Oxa1 family membrane protein insertase
MVLLNFLKNILEFFYDLTTSYGWSIILLSLTVTIIMLPLFWIAEKLQNKERARKAKMQCALDEIKNVKNKQEKHYYTREIYRKNKYSSLYSLTGLLGLVIQIPFFLAAYWLLLEYTPLDGVSFGPIKDLFQPDGLISFEGFSINVLPFLMTIVNLYAGYLYTKNMNKSEQVQLILIAFVFLILLYNLSAALVLYWTMNNVFAIGKNWVINNAINSKVNKLMESRVTKLYGIALSQFDKMRNQISHKTLYRKTKRSLMKLTGVRYYLALLTLPYLSIVCESFYAFLISLLLLLLLGLFDIIFEKGNYVWKHIYLAIFISLFVFLYSMMINDIIDLFKEKYYLNSLQIRLRHVYTVIIPLFLIIYYKSNHKKIYSIFSILVIVFCFTSLIQPIIKNIKEPKNPNLEGNNVFAKLESKYNRKTTILLIFDAYSSPEEIRKIDPNQNTEELVDYMELKNDWVIKREFPTLEGSTYNSVHSTLNYNLSDPLKPNHYFDDYEGTFYYRTRGTSKLINDLESKNVSIKNYGQLNIKGVNEDDPLQIRQPVDTGPFANNFPNIKSFVPFNKYLQNSETFFMLISKTLLPSFLTDSDITSFQSGNRKLFSVLNEEEFEKYDFLIYHFMMPHAPFGYYDEFILEEGDGTDSQYAKFWQFTNSKIINFLDSLDYDKYRIIISADHGYRHSSKVDRLNTFGAFYGFNKEDVDKVKYVQDIGSLINHSFK